MRIIYEDVIKKVGNAIAYFYARDQYLLVHDVSERSISHKLGCYLQLFFKDFHVDCEYNRNVLDSNGFSKKIYYYEHKWKNIYPDIIVHRRGTNESNALIIECKKISNRDLDYDREKMKLYTTSNNGNLGYRYGINLIFSNISGYKIDGSIVIYKNGLPINKYYFYWQEKKLKLESVRLPTYESIQNYIDKKYSVSIKTCWIADIKEEYGLPIKKAHTSKNINKRENPCPNDKRNFILEAYHHFGCILDTNYRTEKY